MTIISVVIGLFAVSAAAELPGLQPEDCGKCHAFQLKMISEDGGKHAREVGCLDCHPQHPPKGKNTKTDCVLCHEGQPHFEIGNCQACHADPHKPLVSLRDPLKPAKKECLSCHADIGQAMTAEPSHHSKLFCNRCHRQHKQIPGCLDCHQPHLQEQRVADCLRCHPAHQPLMIIPKGFIADQECRVCHRPQAADIAATMTRHGGLNCFYCHNGRHPTIPDCQSCHGLPHSQSIHGRYRDCLACHGDAHRLISNK